MLHFLVYPPVESDSDGMALLHIPIGRFMVVFLSREYFELDFPENAFDENESPGQGVEPNSDMTPVRMQDPHLYFEDQGIVVIYENVFIEDADTKHGKARRVNPFESIFSDDATLYTLSCFGTDERIVATPENIHKAIGWCLKNQNFMESPEGI